jgi:hypothetical protein
MSSLNMRLRMRRAPAPALASKLNHAQSLGIPSLSIARSLRTRQRSPNPRRANSREPIEQADLTARLD